MDKTEQITCPVCGKQHTVLMHYKPSMWRLDYTPMEPVEKKLNAYTICDCGMLCYNRAHTVYKPQEMLQDEQYQSILARSDIDENVKKMMLMERGFFDKGMQLLMAHYYYECNMPQQRHACLERALQQLRAGKDTVHARLDGASIEALKSKKLHPLMGTLDYVAEYRQIDVLRQLGEYDAAQQLLTKMMHHHELLPIERKFLECEHTLIQQCDNQPH